MFVFNHDENVVVKCIFFVDLMIYIGCYEPVALCTDRFETYITAKVMVEPGGRVPGMVNWIHQHVYISHYKGMLHFIKVKYCRYLCCSLNWQKSVYMYMQEMVNLLLLWDSMSQCVKYGWLLSAQIKCTFFIIVNLHGPFLEETVLIIEMGVPFELNHCVWCTKMRVIQGQVYCWQNTKLQVRLKCTMISCI